MLSAIKRGIKNGIIRFAAAIDESNNETGWDRYAAKWHAEYGERAAFLGDEWTGEIKEADAQDAFLSLVEQRLMAPYFGDKVETIVEIGSGGGRITSLLLNYCTRRLLACDVSSKMLRLLGDRFAGDARVQRHKLTIGKGVSELPKDVADVVFSFDVFVHIDPHDIYEYVATVKDVLKPGALAVIHHAAIESKEGWLRFLDDHPWCMNRRKPYCSFSVMTAEIMRIFVEGAGLEVVEQIRSLTPDKTEERDVVTIFRRPASAA